MIMMQKVEKIDYRVEGKKIFFLSYMQPREKKVEILFLMGN